MMMFGGVMGFFVVMMCMKVMYNNFRVIFTLVVVSFIIVIFIFIKGV